MSFHDSLIAKFDIYKQVVTRTQLCCVLKVPQLERDMEFLDFCKFLMFSSFVPNSTLDYQKDTTSRSCADDEFILSVQEASSNFLLVILCTRITINTCLNYGISSQAFGLMMLVTTWVVQERTQMQMMIVWVSISQVQKCLGPQTTDAWLEKKRTCILIDV